MTDNVVILVPRRADNGHRDRLWAHCRSVWTDRNPSWRIVEGHHDEGPFNRSAAINKAAKIAGDWDVALVIDSDALPGEGQAAAAVDRAAETGRACFSFTDYYGLNDHMTTRVLDGFDGDWRKGAKLKMLAGRHVSSCLAVPRRLWETIGGFDEAFRGWGWEDRAFVAACRTLGGGVDRIPGAVFHLWHPTGDAKAAMQSDDYRAAQALACRYESTTSPSEMGDLTWRNPDGVCLVVMTDGRRDVIAECLPTALDHIHGLPITHKIIHDDSADIDYAAFLRLAFGDFELHTTAKRQGFGVSVNRARSLALGTGCPWIFWLEDDFRFRRDIDLKAMSEVLTARPHLVQMALRRQPWFAAEIEAGGVVETNPTAYTDHPTHLEHDLFVTTNPSLMPRWSVAMPWPTKPHSEHLFSKQVLVNGRKSGYWGSRHDDPWITHTGERSGTGY